jgi:hypothetical protein
MNDRMDTIAERIDLALDGEDSLEAALILGETLARVVTGLTTSVDKRRRLIELFVNRGPHALN